MAKKVSFLACPLEEEELDLIDLASVSPQKLLSVAEGLQKIAKKRRIVFNGLLELHERTKEEALTDTLTGLRNRSAFNFAFQSIVDTRSREKGPPFALVLMDVDHFKSVNDTYGHPVGDKVLTSLGRCFLSRIRRSDFCARIGGEEFAFILGYTHEEKDDMIPMESAVRAVNLIRNAVLRMQIVVGKPEKEMRLLVTASFGVGIWDGVESADALMKRVDAALYRAKEGGRNRIELVS